jgi:hypothetical protein
MAVIAFPTLSTPTKITRRPVNSVAVSESIFTKQPQKQVFDAKLYTLDLEYPTIADIAARSEMEVFIMLMGGQENTTLVPDHIRTTTEGVATGTPLVNGASQTGGVVITDGWTINQSPIIKLGDKIQIGNYSYTVTADANSDGSGNATLSIYPNLRVSPATNDPIITSNSATLCRMTTNDTAWVSDNNKYTQGLILSFVEEIP